MTKPGCHVSTEGDKTIRSSRYMTANQWHALKVEKVIILQCFFRQVLARIKTKSLRKTFISRIVQQKEVFELDDSATRNDSDLQSRND
jgi:IQ and ubiquitin-like domain-containing protein